MLIPIQTGSGSPLDDSIRPLTARWPATDHRRGSPRGAGKYKRHTFAARRMLCRGNERGELRQHASKRRGGCFRFSCHVDC